MSKLGRRQFLRGFAGAVGGGIVVGCAAPDRESRVQSLVLAPEQSLPGENLWFATACAHTVEWGNSVVVRNVDGRAIKVEGNPAFAINQGKTHVRSQAGVQSLYHPDRIKTPLKRRGERGNKSFQRITWNEALDLLVQNLRPPHKSLLITGRLGGTRARVAQRFVEALRGTYMIYEPLESTGLRAASRRIFGFDQMPHFDFRNARSVLSFGADFLGTWLSPVQYSLGYSHFRQGEGRQRGILTQFEPHMSMTGANADRVVYINPGQEGAVALSIAQVIVSEGLLPQNVWASALDGVGGAAALAAYAPDLVAPRAAVAAGMAPKLAETIREVAREFASHQPGFAIVGGSALAQTNGSDNAAAVLLLNRIVGSMGVPGGVLPNPPALAQIPAALAPNPFEQWAVAAAKMQSTPADTVFVYDADPVHGLPRRTGFKEGLAKARYVVGMGVFMSDTMALADLVLPATHPFEEWGDFAPDPADGRPVVGYQQPVVTSWTEGRSFGDLLLTLAPEVIGQNAFPWASMQAAVRGTAEARFGNLIVGKTPAENWVELLRNGGVALPAGQSVQGFSAKADWKVESLVEPKFEGGASEYPYHLVPFETISAGLGNEAVTPWLQAAPDPITTVTWTTWVELNPVTAKKLGVERGSIVEVVTPAGAIEAGVYESPVVPPNVVAVPVGLGRAAGGRWLAGHGVNVLSILAPAAVDQATGALAWAATRAKIRKTGESRKLPAFEFHENPRNDGAEPVVQVTRE